MAAAAAAAAKKKKKREANSGQGVRWWGQEGRGPVVGVGVHIDGGVSMIGFNVP